MSLNMPSDRALSWLVGAPLAIAGLAMFDFHTTPRVPTQNVDLTPGRVFQAPPYDPLPCPDGAKPGAVIQPACVSRNRIQPWRYGLTSNSRVLVFSPRRNYRETWARVGNDAVLSHCSGWWCRVEAVIPGRFSPTTNP